MGRSGIIAGTKAAPEHLGDVLVLGLGKSGRAAAEYCARLIRTRADSVTVAAGASSESAQSAARQLEALGVRVVFDRTDIEGRYDLCIASPGISQFEAFYRNAQIASTSIVSEVEFAWRESPEASRWVAVTGTNGKTTTTALAAHILQCCGRRAVAVGNIGDTCLEAVAHDAADIYVTETSSYQLASTVDFAPDAAIILNITPDHIKWHKTHEAYVQAKFKVLANLAESGGLAILDAADDTVRAKVRSLAALSDEQRGFSYVPLGTASGLEGDMRAACGSRNAAFLRSSDRRLIVAIDGAEHELCTADELRIPGLHNVANALAASCAAIYLGCDRASVADALKSFAALEHRLEPCGSVAGTVCYNDSKATNVDATLKALAAFDPRRPIVLLGGDDKGTDLAELVRQAQIHCKAVVCFGAAAPRFLDAFEGAQIPVYSANRLADALDEGLAHSQAGDVVVLSPACASFDEFSCFEERGETFKRLVAERATG